MAVLIISFWWDILIISVIILCTFFTWLSYKYTYWKKRGVAEPTIDLLIRVTIDSIISKENIAFRFTNIYKQTKNKPYVGVYLFTKPTLLVKDPEIIKKIMLKDFAHFTDRAGDLDFEHEPLSNNLFNIGGEKWKKMRAKLTPTFTSSKMKQMFNTLASCSEVMMNHLEKNHEDHIDVKETMSKFTTDVIGSCAFGIDCNSFEEPNSKFRVMGKRAIRLTPKRAVIAFFVVFLPKVARMLNLKITEDDINDFFFNLVKETIRYRETNNVVRNDFLQLLIDMRKGTHDQEATNKNDDFTLTIEELVAQVFVFFIAGYETSSTTASYALYELALNPDVQDILVSEINQVLNKHDGKITYESLNEMSYLTMVIEETLRKYPSLSVFTRKCTKDYVLPDTDIVIEKNTYIFIPVRLIQNDPDYFPNPEKFDPERFTQENKDSRHHFSYTPFGEGPRICIGNRFGMMQVKLGLVTLLRKYKVSVCKDTQIPIRFDRTPFLLMPEGPIILKLSKRSLIET